MADSTGKYNIKAVSNMLGIHAGTLRAWERRYQVVDPVRNDAGHRLYTDEHLKILKWIIEQVDKGFTVGQAVDLLDREEIMNAPNSGSEPVNQIEDMKNNIRTALLQFDESAATRHMDHAFNTFSTETVVMSILGGILVEIGELWERGQITTAHEHYATAYIRTRIGMVFQSLPVNGLLPKVLCVCAPGETHEIGLLVFTFYLKQRGYETIYLGGGIPESDIIKVLDETKSKFAVISVTMSGHLDAGLKLVDRIAKDRKDIQVGIGGTAVHRMKTSFKNKYRQHLIGEHDQDADWLDWMKTNNS
ncbi:MerR family transcriptional regulator [Salisediminibacterium selenitireducens]|uniref:Transcriptional regulator, MerR family n=1 Tax=Bacillus selenitireducens (strain ATCC 700615 / DSM 15326 / MLS10) TaxID=439292 RepID=D6XVC1_BACIE|nr:MerR family transcriptional regulator [Salisediminibacterium selenitireducens]ADH99659.1 transcriptional regulator, MerR family [[Bacillus] selenitireducens MLS10]